MTDSNVSNQVAPSVIRLLRHIEYKPGAFLADGFAINIEGCLDA